MSTRPIGVLSLPLLILCYACCTGKTNATTGFPIDIARSSGRSGDCFTRVAIAVGNHKARLNIEPDLTVSELSQQLREVMSYRAEKVVYVKAAPGVSWGEFLEVVDHVWPEVDVVSILTPEAEGQLRQTYCLSPSCPDCAEFGGFRTRTLR